MPGNVLCRYWLHGACRFGDACTFSHSLEDAESQICRFYLKGECAYGERCRYTHARPDWAAKCKPEAGTGSSSSYATPTVPRPRVDDLTEQLPISQLRLGGQAAQADNGASNGGRGGRGTVRSSTPDGLPLPLPLHPYGAAAKSGGAHGVAGGSAGASAGRDWQQQEQGKAEGQQQHDQEQPQWEDQQEAWPEEEQWEGGGEEAQWGEVGGEEQWEGEGEEAQWGEVGGEEHWEEGDWGEEAWGGGQEAEQGYWAANEGDDDGGQHDTLQPPAGDADDGGSGQQQQHGAWEVPDELSEQQQWATSCPPSLRSLCQQWFRFGTCSQGTSCKLVHGALCPHCHKHALHRADEEAREQHLAECKLRHERLAARTRSAGVECGICLELVMSKAAPGDRKFGLLTGCDHPFCLRCIRSWRQKTDAGADVDTALRTCPVCRTSSFYIVPSMVWPSNAEEKERILAGYKAKLSSIDCMHFNFGEGTCPFSTSCFYRHAYPDGRLEEPSLRRIVDDEGVRVVQPVRLSDFIAISMAGQRLTGARRH